MTNQTALKRDNVHIHLEDLQLSRRFFLLLWVLYAVVYMTKNCFSAAMTSIVAEGILTKTQTGFITACFYLAYTPLQIFGGIFADKYNPERLIKIGLVGGAVSNAVIFFNQNYYVMLIAWTFNAIAQFALWPAIFKIMSSQLCRSDCRSMIYYMSFSSSVGLLMAYLMAAVITDWRYNFAVSAVLLAVFALALHLEYKRVEPKMLPDRPQGTVAREKTPEKQMSSLKLFTLSGVFVVGFVMFLKTTIEQGLKTLSPTMFMETYAGVSPSFGNILGTVIIFLGIAGIVLGRFIYPRFIRDALGAWVALMALAVPFSLVLTAVGKVSVTVMVLSTALVSVLLTASNLLNQHYCLEFIKYGKNGTVAGINNALAALGIVVYSYCFPWLADRYDWSVVMAVCCGMVVLACLLMLLAWWMWKNFHKKDIKMTNHRSDRNGDFFGAYGMLPYEPATNCLPTRFCQFREKNVLRDNEVLHNVQKGGFCLKTLDFLRRRSIIIACPTVKKPSVFKGFRNMRHNILRSVRKIVGQGHDGWYIPQNRNSGDLFCAQTVYVCLFFQKNVANTTEREKTA